MKNDTTTPADAIKAWETYREEQSNIPGMFGLTPRPSFLAGWQARAASQPAQEPVWTQEQIDAIDANVERNMKKMRPSPVDGEPAQEPVAIKELHNIATAKRFDRSVFADDTEFADWAQSRCRHTHAAVSESEAFAPPADTARQDRILELLRAASKALNNSPLKDAINAALEREVRKPA
jgi:hypothetical protein